MKDPIVEEVRETRRKHAELFNFDLHEICKDLKKREKPYAIQSSLCRHKTASEENR